MRAASYTTNKKFSKEKQTSSSSQKAKKILYIIGNINKANLLVIIACQNILQSM